MVINYLRYLFREKYSVEKVFTPSQAAILTFISRKQIEQSFRNALRTPGMQIIVFGPSGSGKTTLLQNELMKSGKKVITTSCTYGMTVDQLILHAFDQLGVYYLDTQSSSKSFNWGGSKTTEITKELKADYAVLSGKIQESGKLNTSYSGSSNRSRNFKRLVPYQLTPQRLAEFMGHAECMWVIEDFHKVEKAERKVMAQVMKVFMDVSNTFDATKIIAIGAVGSGREVVKYDNEMSERIAEISVPLLSDDEVKRIVDKGIELLNLAIPEDTVKNIIYFSNNIASICHQLCLNMCFSSEVYETQRIRTVLGPSTFAEAIDSYVAKKSDTFKEKLDKVLVVQGKSKFLNAELILKAIIDLGKEEVLFQDILKKIQEVEPEYPSGNLTRYLKPLYASIIPDEDEEILRLDETSKLISFANPFFKAYVKMRLADPKSKLETENIINDLLHTINYLE